MEGRYDAQHISERVEPKIRWEFILFEPIKVVALLLLTIILLSEAVSGYAADDVVVVVLA